MRGLPTDICISVGGLDFQSPVEFKWFCLSTHPKHEETVALYLRKVYGLETFFPKFSHKKLTRRGPVLFTEGYFPSYIFCRMVIEQHLIRVKAAPRLRRVVQFKNNPAVVPDEIICELKLQVASQNSCNFPESYKLGGAVIIGVGAFTGESGVIAKILPASKRVGVLMALLNQENYLEFDESSLIPELKMPGSR